MCSEGTVLASYQAPCMSPLSCRSSPRVWLGELDGLGHRNNNYDFGLGRVSLARCPEREKVELTFSPLSWTQFCLVSVYFWTYTLCVILELQILSIKVCLIEFDTQSLKSGHHLQQGLVKYRLALSAQHTQARVISASCWSGQEPPTLE